MEKTYQGQDTGNAVNLKGNLKITVNGSDLRRVRDIAQQMTSEARSEFSSSYGQILELLRIVVEVLVLSGLAQFWNHSLKCFDLPNLDIAPTIEEYAIMLRLPMSKHPNVYLSGGYYVSMGKIAELIGVQANQLDIEKRGGTQGLKKGYLEAHLEFLAQRGEWNLFNKTLALTIFGLVLFSFTSDMVDQAAMDVFFKFEKHRANPIPAILADTFLTMEVCHQKGGGMIRCCTHMLYVWIMTHMDVHNCLGLLPDPLRNFGRIPVRQQKAHEWKNEFMKIGTDSFRWVCPWYHGEEVIFSCGSFPNVPLMGTRGCVSYAPILVLRQLRWTQHVPSDKQLEGFSFLYQKDGTTAKREKEVRDAWKNIHKSGAKELGKHVVIPTPEYLQWREARKAQNSAPQTIPSNEDHPQIISQMTSQMEKLKAQMEFLEQGKEAAELKVVIHKSRCQKLAGEIEYLKDVQADVAEYPSRVKRAKKGKETESDGATAEVQKLRAKVIAQEEMIAGILQEKEELEANARAQDYRVQALQETLTEAKGRSDQGRALATKYHDALVEANRENEHLRLKVQELGQDNEQWRLTAQKLWEQKEEWRKKNEDISDSLRYHTAQLIARFEEANVQVHPWLRLPSKIADFMRYCGSLIKGFRKKHTKSLM